MNKQNISKLNHCLHILRKYLILIVINLLDNHREASYNYVTINTTQTYKQYKIKSYFGILPIPNSTHSIQRSFSVND